MMLWKSRFWRSSSVDLEPPAAVESAALFPGPDERGSATAPRGAWIGEYRVVSEIGRGGMSVVHAVQDAQGKVFALKVASGSETHLLREATLLRSVTSPHVVRCFGLHLGDPSFLKLEFLSGETLEQRLLAKGRLEIAEIGYLVDQMLSGLEAVHDQGIVHSDLKPGNLFLTKARKGADKLKIVDFGLARRLGEPSTTPELMGTAVYAAPEQWRESQLAASTDLYSLGVVIFEMATGLSPWKSGDARTLLGEKLRGPSRQVGDFRSDFPSPWSDLVKALLLADPNARPASSREVRDRWLVGLRR